MMGVFVQVGKRDTTVYLIQESGCWEWLALNSNGYGVWRRPKGRSNAAHRSMYELHKGPIPKGLHLDHLCRNRGCVNPDHLEPVTPQENSRRAIGKFCTTPNRLQGPYSPWEVVVRKGVPYLTRLAPRGWVSQIPTCRGLTGPALLGEAYREAHYLDLLPDDGCAFP